MGEVNVHGFACKKRAHGRHEKVGFQRQRVPVQAFYEGCLFGFSKNRKGVANGFAALVDRDCLWPLRS